MQVYYVTFPDTDTAAEISEELVEDGAAACANIHPIRSIYRWDGKMQHDDEAAVLFKTTQDDFPDTVADIHPYDVPCILALTVEANDAYREWVDSQCR